MRSSLTIATLLLSLTNPCLADRSVSGRVVNTDGTPVRQVTVAPYWRANGSPVRPDGSDYDLSDPVQNEQFWSNVGEMEPWKPPAVTSDDGRFRISLTDRTLHLLVLDADRIHGAIVDVPKDQESELEVRLRPLVSVTGQLESIVAGKPVDWSHVYVELAADPKQPLATRRLISCGSYDAGRFAFQLPPGRYRLDAYGNSDRNCDVIDLRASAPERLSIDGTQQQIELGKLSLSKAKPDRTQLESASKSSGRWRDYTDHYGETAPNWHALDARGIPKEANVKDFRGRWLMVHFWGLSCAPCLATGVPEMIEFYGEHAGQRDRFEIVGVCIDFQDQIPDFEALDEGLAPIVENVWKGRQIEYPLVLDNTFQSWERYGIPGLGTVVLIDPDGNLHQGDAKTLRRILAADP